MSVFIPFVQWKQHVELKPGDFTRIQSKYYIIDEVRKFRRFFAFTATETRDLTQLTGSMAKRFIHTDKFAIQPATGQTVTVTLTYRGVDVTGLQYAHVWNFQNAGVTAPDELDINSFAQEDIVRAVVTIAGAAGTTNLWFSGEEYSLVDYPPSRLPPRFIIVHPYGFSRVVTEEEFEDGEMASRLRT